VLGAGAGVLAPRVVRAGAPSAVAALLAELEAASAGLRDGSLDGPSWQRRAVELLTGFDAGRLRAALGLDWSQIRATTRAEGRFEARLELGELDGTPDHPHFRRKLFSLATDRAILPHGHRHIVSVFVVLDGRARGRHYDRLRDEPDAILIRPTDDRVFTPGDCAAISDQVDNVHWFHALDDRTVLLNFSATVPPSRRVDAGPAGRVYLDPDGEVLDDGVIRAPRAGVAQLRAKYG
jgi:hypothetical protein